MAAAMQRFEEQLEAEERARAALEHRDQELEREDRRIEALFGFLHRRYRLDRDEAPPPTLARLAAARLRYEDPEWERLARGEWVSCQ